MREIAAPVVLLLGVAVAGLTVSAYRDGPPEGHTGGFGEPTCQACHFGGELNEAAGTLEIRELPAVFTPGQTYPLQVVLRRPAMPVGGFELAARFAPGSAGAGAQAGKLEAVDDHADVFDAPNGISYAHHTRAGSTAAGDSIVWGLRWTAPSRSGPVVFHVAGNAGDDDESPLGDFIYTAERVVEPDSL